MACGGGGVCAPYDDEDGAFETGKHSNAVRNPDSQQMCAVFGMATQRSSGPGWVPHNVPPKIGARSAGCVPAKFCARCRCRPHPHPPFLRAGRRRIGPTGERPPSTALPAASAHRMPQPPPPPHSMAATTTSSSSGEPSNVAHFSSPHASALVATATTTPATGST